MARTGRQDNGAAIPRHTFYHIEQRLLPDHQVEQLWRIIGIYGMLVTCCADPSVSMWWKINVRGISHQKAVEELVHEEAQDADHGVAQMVDEEHVHNHCFVASSERPLVSHKTYKKDELVEELKEKKPQEYK